jgi:hypothetical protein
MGRSATYVLIFRAVEYGLAQGTSDDYTYDVNGNVLSDKNKGITSIVYNYLSKPTRVNFQDGKSQEYRYDAGGTRLSLKVYQGTTLQKTTDYVGGFVYEENVLQFFASQSIISASIIM